MIAHQEQGLGQDEQALGRGRVGRQELLRLRLQLARAGGGQVTQVPL